MKKKKGLVMRRMGDEAMIVAESLELIDFDRIVALNTSAAYIWESLPETDFDCGSIAALLMARYDVEYSTAMTDARELADVWLRAGVIED